MGNWFEGAPPAPYALEKKERGRPVRAHLRGQMAPRSCSGRSPALAVLMELRGRPRAVLSAMGGPGSSCRFLYARAMTKLLGEGPNACAMWRACASPISAPAAPAIPFPLAGLGRAGHARGAGTRAFHRHLQLASSPKQPRPRGHRATQRPTELPPMVYAALAEGDRGGPRPRALKTCCRTGTEGARGQNLPHHPARHLRAPRAFPSPRAPDWLGRPGPAFRIDSGDPRRGRRDPAIPLGGRPPGAEETPRQRGWLTLLPDGPRVDRIEEPEAPRFGGPG